MSARKDNASRPLARSQCPVANTLDVIGDKWSLLVIRDLFSGKKTYGELAASPERIPTNLLADRLKRLEDAGIIQSALYQERPARRAYTLTGKGTDLGEVIGAIARWGKKHIPGTKTLSEQAAEASKAPARPSKRKRPSR